ncbi:conserved hypothetical protein [Chloroherpeton thalassium ATCC 35110]|uniref:Uncharacterized protein n=1 Tax=Chloroherpeton thalassium (strain ATCC 35110 / GB-78) TaxID=517418 RepID=B3QXG0_CHLT3|nr:hypothetical protein [Chloroherpeton thalassium]ACF13434.1 conserved hypothetical protein [Chloroherpeton thalassium ATCC 35110]
MLDQLSDIVEAAGAAIEIPGQILLTPIVRNWRVHWGATEEEATKRLPGDDFVPEPKWSYTHAIDIKASAEKIWPWIAQIGQGRGGFYSYEMLENAIGCDIHNADKILPEYQNLKIGDTITLHPKNQPLQVAKLVPNKLLVLCGHNEDGSIVESTWGFYLIDNPNGGTRLIVRGRYQYGDNFLSNVLLGPGLLEPVNFVMSRKMMDGIKNLAEKQPDATMTKIQIIR